MVAEAVMIVLQLFSNNSMPVVQGDKVVVCQEAELIEHGHKLK